MSKPKFTKGPWTVDEEAFDNDGCPETVIRALNGVAGVAVAIDFGPNNPGMREANARLIAAAPDLLEALQLALHELESYCFDESGEHYNNPQINAALAKAGVQS